MEFAQRATQLAKNIKKRKLEEQNNQKLNALQLAQRAAQLGKSIRKKQKVAKGVLQQSKTNLQNVQSSLSDIEFRKMQKLRQSIIEKMDEETRRICGHLQDIEELRECQRKVRNMQTNRRLRSAKNIQTWYRNIHRERQQQLRKIQRQQTSEFKTEDDVPTLDRNALTIEISETYRQVSNILFNTQIRVQKLREWNITDINDVQFRQNERTAYRIKDLDLKIKIHRTHKGAPMLLLSGDALIANKSLVPQNFVEQSTKRNRKTGKISTCRAHFKKPRFNMPLKAYMYNDNERTRLSLLTLKITFQNLIEKFANVIIDEGAPLNKTMADGGIIQWDFPCDMPEDLQNILNRKQRTWDNRLNPRFDGTFRYTFDKSAISSATIETIYRKFFKNTAFEQFFFPKYIRDIVTNLNRFWNSEQRLCIAGFTGHARCFIKLNNQIVMIDPWKQQEERTQKFKEFKNDLKNRHDIDLEFIKHPAEQGHEGSCVAVAFARAISIAYRMMNGESDQQIIDSLQSPMPCYIVLFASRLISMNRK